MAQPKAAVPTDVAPESGGNGDVAATGDTRATYAIPDAATPPPAPGATTPLMAQYHAIKAEHPDRLLFYRMGDFYELFFDDAVKAAAALDIVLTKRGKHDGDDIPMCGVPVHSADAYLQRLIRKGFKVAVCEQSEDPAEAKKRGSKSVVRRDVVRIVTAGTLTEDTLLDARAHNYLAALADAGGALGLAWLDMSTGEFTIQPVVPANLSAALARLDAGELLLPERLVEKPEHFELWREWRSRLSPLPSSRFDSENARRRLEAIFGVKALDAFGNFDRAEIAAAGALLDYVSLTQQGRLPRIAQPRRLSAGAVIEIDAATRRNLELVRNLSGEREGSLLAAIDRTVTGAGARMLAAALAAPLTDPERIGARLDMIGFLIADDRLREDLRGILRRTPDLERALSRLTLNRGSPRDLGAVRDALMAAGEMRVLLAEPSRSDQPAGIAAAARGLGDHAGLIERLGRALGPDLPLNANDGGFIARTYHAELDETRNLRDESRKLIAGLEQRYRTETGISSLKIRHNNVLGYYVEVTPAHADKLKSGADASRFIHRQGLTSAARFTTVELGELEQKIAGAADKALAIELALFADLAGEIIARADAVAETGRALAVLDMGSGLAQLARDSGWCRPTVDDSAEFRIEGGRHPVVEPALAKSQDATFVPNDCDLGPAQRLWLVTGPNMAGKSTFLRQNALIAILAQTGSYVPAKSAHIGAVDRLFSRVGAADDLARGRSTFMVEMVETAAILNQATERSLVILDEIGRGTATFDGLSIAWATVEHLHETNKCRALFATHYHELTALTARLERLAAYTMRVKEWKGEVVFLHEVAPGAADRSYGIHVAKLAGLPEQAVTRAEEVLRMLEAGEQAGALKRLADDLPLFSAAVARPKSGASSGSDGPSPLEQALAAVNPDELSPKDALDALYRLRGLLSKP
jgi:DNA mismatch repair protein MutS